MGINGRVLSREHGGEEKWYHVASPSFNPLHLPLQIVYAERPLTDNHRSLASYGLKDGDVVILRQKENADPRPPVQFSSKPNTHGLLINKCQAKGHRLAACCITLGRSLAF